MTAPGHTPFGAADLERVVLEARPRLLGARVKAVLPRGREGFILALERPDSEAADPWAQGTHERLLVALEPGTARAHLEPERGPRTKDRAASPFEERLRARIAGARLASIEEVPGDRVLRLVLEPPPVEGSAGGRLVLWLSFFAVRADAVLEEEEGGAVVAALREGGGRPLLSSGAAPRRAPLFPGIAPDPASLAYTRAVAARFAALEAERAAEETRRALEGELQKRRRKAEGARRRLAEAVVATGKADEQQRLGEMLLASLHLVRRGASEVVVPDYWAGEGAERAIALDPALAPQEQAGRYFKAAKKARRGAEITRTRLAAFEAEIAAIDEALASLAAGAPPIGALSRVGVGEGVSPSPAEVARKAKIPLPSQQSRPARVHAGGKGKGKAREQDGPGGPRRFVSRDGLDVLVGRSNKENDELTTRIARSEDLFFHVSGFPGSHVIVRAQRGKSVPLETLLDAATLAVHYSKARGRVRTEVGYTPRKWVRKPRGAKPGLVIVERQKTIVVAGEGERLARLLAGAAGGEDAPGDSPAAPGAGLRTDPEPRRGADFGENAE